MTKKELIKKLEPYHEDDVVCHSSEFGWANVDSVTNDGNMILLITGDHPETEKEECRVR